MSIPELRVGVLAVGLVCSVALFSAALWPQTSSAHLHGQVAFSASDLAPGAELTFRNDKTERTAMTDQNGHYEVDLPVGEYTMTAKVFFRGVLLQEQDRPLFQIASPKDLSLNVRMGPNVYCDHILPTDEPAQKPDPDAWICGGARDVFPVPAGKLPFELAIRYNSRKETEQGFVYNAGEHQPALDLAAEASYNLFTLHAAKMLYIVRDHVIDASGGVVAEWADGPTKRADSMRIKIENGEAVVLQ